MISDTEITVSVIVSFLMMLPLLSSLAHAILHVPVRSCMLRKYGLVGTDMGRDWVKLC